MSNMNLVIIEGRLVKDPEEKAGSNWTKTTFSIASSDYQGKDKDDYTSFFNVVAWGKNAELITKYFKKGQPIKIQGKIRQDRWENESGEKRNAIIIILDKFFFALTDKSKGDNQPLYPENNQPLPSTLVDSSDDNPFSDESIPF